MRGPSLELLLLTEQRNGSSSAVSNGELSGSYLRRVALDSMCIVVTPLNSRCSSKMEKCFKPLHRFVFERPVCILSLTCKIPFVDIICNCCNNK